MTQKYDLAIIGSGPGGYVAAIRAAQLGLKTICIEKDQTLGGTCLNVGCIPSKALLQSTENYALLKNEGQEHGIECSELKIDFSKILSRKAGIVKGLTEGIAALFKKNGVVHLVGTAQFVTPQSIEVTQGTTKQLIEAENVIIATGSEPISLPFLKVDEKKIVTSTGALSLETVPKKMVVIGAGVIGVELASVYQRLGTEVTIVELLDRVCPTMDEAISKALLQILKKQGLQFHLSAAVSAVKQNKKGEQVVSIKLGKEEMELTADVVLVAVGRRPYTAGLQLDKIGVSMDPRGFIQVDNSFCTPQPHLYAIGDVIEGPMLAHRASEEGVAVVEMLAGKSSHLNYIAIPNVIYTHPEVAAVGFTEKEARELGMTPFVGQCAFRGNPRARCGGYIDGFVKVVGEKQSGRLIGMHIIGAHASEIIGEGVIAIEKGLTVEELANTSHAHPTLAEAIKEACLHALGRAIHL